MGLSALLLAQVLAFPGADGLGRYTVGGRGGQVLIVDSLKDDASPGTLRWAIEQAGPRIVVFSVSGVIDLKKPLVISQGQLTLAGQSSPGGIVLKGAETRVEADQVIIRYLRFRLGRVKDDWDAINGRQHSDIIIDHCSMSWSIDEAASFYNNRRFTLQYSLIAQSLDHAGHSKGEHGYGGIWGGRGASFHHNLLANHQSRLPRFNGWRLGPNYPQGEELVDFRNNVIFNWGEHGSYGNEQGKVNIIGNSYLPGPASQHRAIFELWGADKAGDLFLAGNLMAGKASASLTAWPRLNEEDMATLAAKHQKTKAFTYPAMPLMLASQSAEASYQLLVQEGEVGANRNAHGLFRDSVDSAVLSEVKSGQGRLIDSELDAIESWVAYGREFKQKPVVDANHNGMADDWEQRHGVSDPNGYGLSGDYSNIESYLNDLGQFTAP